jgi:hypothetical protein
MFLPSNPRILVVEDIAKENFTIYKNCGKIRKNEDRKPYFTICYFHKPIFYAINRVYRIWSVINVDALYQNIVQRI